MSLQAALVSRLRADTDVSAVVGTRIYPAVVPQQARTYPVICYEMDSREDVTCYDGFTSNLSSQRFTVASIARTYPEATDLAAKVRAALDQQYGMWGSLSVNSCEHEDERESQETIPGVGQDGRFWIIAQDYKTWLRPA